MFAAFRARWSFARSASARLVGRRGWHYLRMPTAFCRSHPRLVPIDRAVGDCLQFRCTVGEDASPYSGEFDGKTFHLLLSPPQFSACARCGSVGADAAVGTASADTRTAQAKPEWIGGSEWSQDLVRRFWAWSARYLGAWWKRKFELLGASESSSPTRSASRRSAHSFSFSNPCAGL